MYLLAHLFTHSLFSLYIGLSSDLMGKSLVVGQQECVYAFHHYIALHIPLQDNIIIHNEPRQVDIVAVIVTRIIEWKKVTTYSIVSSLTHSLS